ncbi:hypothetical protein EYC80_009012 [Monilinia laxa]|uniref:Uncharacterized protein n=1 Tax=Monilinia laxa TaxID=61186 RepID=A0A5N6K279_MONLA|nr:hypothetical protein EYC80_009012 [Monilinia laxa]
MKMTALVHLFKAFRRMIFMKRFIDLHNTYSPSDSITFIMRADYTTLCLQLIPLGYFRFGTSSSCGGTFISSWASIRILV